MNRLSRLFSFGALALGSVLWLAGCSPPAKEPSKPATDMPADHKPADAGKDHVGDKPTADKDHEEKPLTESDIQMPANFKAGVARLEQLHAKIAQLIQSNQLDDVHRAAEEMALVARKMKELAAKDLSAEQQTEAGRLCNEIAGYYKPIDAAADAGKKDETSSIHQQMAKTLQNLKALAK